MDDEDDDGHELLFTGISSFAFVRLNAPVLTREQPRGEDLLCRPEQCRERLT